MITQKLSIKESNKAPQIVILEIRPENSHKIKNNRINCLKIRKLQAAKPSRGMRSFDKLDFNFFLKEHEAFQEQPNLSLPRNNHQSAYLAYKEEQKHSKAKHSNKSNFLKNRWLQHKYSLEASPKQETHRTIQTFDVQRNRRKMSMVVLGQCISEGNDDLSTLSHSKNIYIKTSQGKRQKINTNTYMAKIKEKIFNLSERQANNGFSLVNLWGDSNQMQIRVNHQFNADRHTAGRNIRTRSIKKQAVCRKVDDTADDCRPWTSNKSEAPQQ